MEKTKIQLSAQELVLMQNSEWILTKNRIIEKLCQGLGDLAMKMREEVDGRRQMFPEKIIKSNPKISKGEKYQGLPYVILDYPRSFEKEEILAIRTFFWWGNFSSITLHVKGSYPAAFLQRITANLPILRERNFVIATSGNEWNHDVTSNDYESFAGLSEHELEKRFFNNHFVKIASKQAFSQWDQMEVKLLEDFRVLLMLAAS